MDELTYILMQVKRFQHKQWDSAELEKCKAMLGCLSRQELMLFNKNLWISEDDMLKAEIIKILYTGVIGERKERIVDMDTDDLISLFLNKKDGVVDITCQDGNVALARQELKRRYKANIGENRAKISIAFAQTSMKDFRWIDSQIRKELYEGGS